MSETYAAKMAAALNELGQHTFRDGKVVATVDGFYSQGNCFVVENVSATYDDVPVILDTPLNWINFDSSDDPVYAAHSLIADLIRLMVA